MGILSFLGVSCLSCGYPGWPSTVVLESLGGRRSFCEVSCLSWVALYGGPGKPWGYPPFCGVSCLPGAYPAFLVVVAHLGRYPVLERGILPSWGYPGRLVEPRPFCVFLQDVFCPSGSYPACLVGILPFWGVTCLSWGAPCLDQGGNLWACPKP